MQKIETRRLNPRTRKTTVQLVKSPIKTTVCYDIRNWDELKKIDLKDCTFIIPVFHDHKDREQNLNLTINHLLKHFDTNIIVGEQGSSEFMYVDKYVRYVKFDLQHFHRTKMLNDMTAMAKTPIVFNWDADVSAPPMQIFKAVEMLRSGEADFVYPYDGRFARVPRDLFAEMFNKYMDLGIFAKQKFRGTKLGDMMSVGGAIGYSKQKFFEAGGENENFISYGAEDLERKERFEKLGYIVKRVNGIIFHIDHWIGINSSSKNPYFEKCRNEFDRIRIMSREELLKYVSTWNWRK